MKFPTVLIIKGTDSIELKARLKFLHISFKTQRGKAINGLSKLLIPDFINQGYFSIENLYEGMKLCLFQMQTINLHHLYTDWLFPTWNFNMDADLEHWVVINNKNFTIATLIHYGMCRDQETLKMYQNSLIPTFRHPDVQRTLRRCAIRKEKHVNMWDTARRKLQLPEPNIQPYPNIKRKTCFTLKNAILDLLEISTSEELLQTSISDCFKILVKQGKLIKLSKAVEYRNQDNYEHNIFLKKLIDEVYRQYPFLHSLIFNKININQYISNTQENFFKNFELEMS